MCLKTVCFWCWYSKFFFGSAKYWAVSLNADYFDLLWWSMFICSVHTAKCWRDFTQCVKLMLNYICHLHYRRITSPLPIAIFFINLQLNTLKCCNRLFQIQGKVSLFHEFKEGKTWTDIKIQFKSKLVTDQSKVNINKNYKNLFLNWYSLSIKTPHFIMTCICL